MREQQFIHASEPTFFTGLAHYYRFTSCVAAVAAAAAAAAVGVAVGVGWCGWVYIKIITG